MEDDGGGVAGVAAVDVDAVAQLHPGHREDGAGVGARQTELVLLTVTQQVQLHCAQAGGSTVCTHVSQEYLKIALFQFRIGTYKLPANKKFNNISVDE